MIEYMKGKYGKNKNKLCLDSQRESKTDSSLVYCSHPITALSSLLGESQVCKEEDIQLSHVDQQFSEVSLRIMSA